MRACVPDRARERTREGVRMEAEQCRCDAAVCVCVRSGGEEWEARGNVRGETVKKSQRQTASSNERRG